MNIGQNQLPEGWEIKKLGEVCDTGTVIFSREVLRNRNIFGEI